MTTFRKDEILTRTGQVVSLTHPTPAIIDPSDIAHALSNLCRYTGHTKSFYSVAHHTLLVASLVPASLRPQAILHDAAEAYLGDMSTPLKALLPDYRVLESRFQRAIGKRFGVSMAANKFVKRADLLALWAESYRLMPETFELCVFSDRERQEALIAFDAARFNTESVFNRLYGELRSTLNKRK